MTDLPAPNEPVQSPPPAKRIALALSGGGFRATLFHLGTIRYLYEANLLKHVRYLTSVSGGSILAAHVALNWEDYTADANAENSWRAASALRKFVQSDVRGTIVQRWLFSFLSLIPYLLRYARIQKLVKHGNSWSRIAQLQHHYSKLFSGAKLTNLTARKAGDTEPPELHILATSATTGRLCSFTGHGFHISALEGDKMVERKLLHGRIPVSLAVATSSAFPVLFPPVAVDHTSLDCDENEFPTTERLIDGGVFENLGIYHLRQMHTHGHLDISHIIISDAQAQFDWDLSSQFRWIGARANRSIDVLMKQVTTYETSATTDYFCAKGVVLVNCQISKLISKKDHDCTALDPALQRQIARIRTDLDRFSDEEIYALVRQGYAQARLACEHAGLTTETAANAKTAPWSLISPAPDIAALDLSASRHQRWNIWHWRKLESWFNLGLLILWCTLALWIFDRGVQSLRGLYLAWAERPMALLHLGKVHEEVLGADQLRQLTYTEYLAYERFLGLVGDASYQIIRIQSEPFTAQTARRSAKSLRCRLVFGDDGEIVPIGVTVFHVRPQGGERFYQALKTTVAMRDKLGLFDFAVPPSAPDDFIVLLACVPVKAGEALPPLKRLVHLE